MAIVSDSTTFSTFDKSALKFGMGMLFISENLSLNNGRLAVMLTFQTGRENQNDKYELHLLFFEL